MFYFQVQSEARAVDTVPQYVCTYLLNQYRSVDHVTSPPETPYICFLRHTAHHPTLATLPSCVLLGPSRDWQSLSSSYGAIAIYALPSLACPSWVQWTAEWRRWKANPVRIPYVKDPGTVNNTGVMHFSPARSLPVRSSIKRKPGGGQGGGPNNKTVKVCFVPSVRSSVT
jgi:hypothetical protein